MTPENQTLLTALKARLEARNPENLKWSEVETRLLAHPDKLQTLLHMETSGGQCEAFSRNSATQEILFLDCAPESPQGRRSCCYDQTARLGRKTAAPRASAQELAESWGASLLDEDLYRLLQARIPVDQKTSSWLATPSEVRSLGGALFGDQRYRRVFVYHNGADSYYASRGFRCALWV